MSKWMGVVLVGCVIVAGGMVYMGHSAQKAACIASSEGWGGC